MEADLMSAGVVASMQHWQLCTKVVHMPVFFRSLAQAQWVSVVVLYHF